MNENGAGEEPEDVERVSLEVHRSVKVVGTNDRPAFELTNVNGDVSIKRLNAYAKAAVRVDDLVAAVDALKADG